MPEWALAAHINVAKHHRGERRRPRYPGRVAVDERAARRLRERPVATVCAKIDPFDPALEGPLYAPQVVPDDEAEVRRQASFSGHASEYARAWSRTRCLRHAQLLINVSGDPLGAPTPFVLDGLECASVWSFYQALKLDGDERVAVAAGRRNHRPGPLRDSFEFAGETITVDSVADGVLVARATEAKVRAHDRVRRALAATGAARLYMGGPRSQVLGRYMPFALMLLRLRGA